MVEFFKGLNNKLIIKQQQQNSVADSIFRKEGIGKLCIKFYVSFLQTFLKAICKARVGQFSCD